MEFINSISLISCSTCNLNCSFCYLHKNKSYHEYDKLVREAWNNGSYIDNVYNSIKALKIDISKIEIMQLWGGETLLHIKDVTKNIEKIYNYFPKINKWCISTNWLVDIDDFFDFILTIDKYALNKVNIDMQLSIDGPPGIFSEQGHNGSWEQYRNNIKKFTNLVNNYKLKKVHIQFKINATIDSKIYLQELLNYNTMYNYIKYMKEFLNEIEEQCISSALSVGQDIVFPGYAQPALDTVEEAKKYAEICKLWEKVRRDHYPEIPPAFGFYYGSGQINRNKSLNTQNLECGELLCALTFNYDGSIIECNGCYIDTFEGYQKELLENNQYHEYYNTKLRNALSYNPALLSEEELEKKDWVIHNGYKNNNSTYLYFMMLIADELEKSNQISPIYKDKMLLLKHLSVLSNLITCTRENINTTRVSFICAPSLLRRYLNGTLEYAYNSQYLEELIKRDEFIFEEKESCNEWNCNN